MMAMLNLLLADPGDPIVPALTLGKDTLNCARADLINRPSIYSSTFLIK